MKILGISAFYHDSAAALVQDGVIIAAAQEERFSRKKHDAGFPVHAVKFCLQYAGCSINDLDAIVFYDKPFLKFERLLETYCAFAPKGLISFLVSMPLWIKEKLFLKNIIYKQLAAIAPFDKKKVKLLFSEHHLSHAASAFFPAAFEEAAILTVDGVGEWATASICKGHGNSITVLKELEFPHSVGLLYSAFTYYCGFTVNSGEYKLMGLAPYGNKDGSAYLRYLDIIRTKLAVINDDGSVFLHQEYFSYATGLRMVPDRKWEVLFGFPRRKDDSALEQYHCDLALAIQTVTEEIILKMAGEAKRLTGSSHLCMAGGVALNCVANGKLHASGLFDEIFIQPAAGDAGGALGAALATHYIYFNQLRPVPGETDSQKGSFLGTGFTDEAVHSMIKEYQAVAQYYGDTNELLQQSALLLAAGNVIGWHQGRMEFGPRALGARSILADARNPEMQKKLNLKIKYRESFRPFAPIVLFEEVSDYFDLDGASPYMLLVKQVKPSRCNALPDGYEGWDPMEKLYFKRSDIPAVTHVDYSARVQTVHKNTGEMLWRLLQEFRKLTGYAVLVNTSFNVRDEPIVNDPQDAYHCFMNTEMDYLVIGNYILAKKDQPPPGAQKLKISR
ncbi:carbamoyltransferase family protein [Flavitalea flava]